MVFHKYAPSNHLSQLVDYYWTLSSSEKEQELTYRFVPDGYVDWVFHIGTPWSFKFPDGHLHQQSSRCHVFGQIKQHVDLDISKGDLNLFGVKFFPWTAKLIWQIDMHYLTDRCDDLHDLDLKRMTEFQDRIMEAHSTEARIKIMNSYLESFSHLRIDQSLKSLLAELQAGQELDLRQKYGIGIRRLEQRFREDIGISPKLFSRTIRLNELIWAMRHSTGKSLTQLAMDADFYDQSHFIKDFRKFTGYSPKQFLKAINPDGDILNLKAS